MNKTIIDLYHQPTYQKNHLVKREFINEKMEKTGELIYD